MDYLIRFVQVNESFRKPEIESLASLYNIPFEWVSYSEKVRIALNNNSTLPVVF